MKLEDYGILAGIITALLTGGRFLYLKYKETQLKYRTKLNNHWTNEGNIGGEPQTHYIQIALNVDVEDGEITGIINSRSLTTGDEMRFGVNGQISYKTAKIYFIKVSQGRVSTLGKSKLTFNNMKTLKWRIMSDFNDFFPKKTTVWVSANNLLEE